MRKSEREKMENRTGIDRIINNRDGISLVEIVIASMLVGMILLAAFPLILTGRNVVSRKQKEMEAEMLGDSVFKGISKELQNAGDIYFGTEEELLDRYGTSEISNWKRVDLDLHKYGYDVEIAAEAVGEEWIMLSVKFMEDEAVYYEREEMILLPNVGLYEENLLEKTDGPWILNINAMESGTEDQIWCRIVQQ